MQGSSGFCSFNVRGCEGALQRSYTVAITDMEHQSSALDGELTYNNRKVEIDFGYRDTYDRCRGIGGPHLADSFTRKTD